MDKRGLDVCEDGGSEHGHGVYSSCAMDEGSESAMDVGSEQGHGDFFSSVDIVTESYADWESLAHKEGMATGFFSDHPGYPTEAGLREKCLPEQNEPWGIFSLPPPASLIKNGHASSQPRSPQEHIKDPPWERAEALFGDHQDSAAPGSGSGMCDAIDSGHEAPSTSEQMWSADEMEVPAAWVHVGSSWMSRVAGSVQEDAALSAEGGDGEAAAARVRDQAEAGARGATRGQATRSYVNVMDEGRTAGSKLRVSVKEFAAAVKQRLGSNRKARGAAGRAGARGSGRSASRTRGGGNRRASPDRNHGGVRGMASSGANLSHKAQHCVRTFVAGFRKRMKGSWSAADTPRSQAHQGDGDVCLNPKPLTGERRKAPPEHSGAAFPECSGGESGLARVPHPARVPHGGMWHRRGTLAGPDSGQTLPRPSGVASDGQVAALMVTSSCA